MGWVFAIGLAALSFVMLWKLGRISRMALELSAAAILIGLAGYAWQGSPDMPGNPVSSSPR